MNGRLFATFPALALLASLANATTIEFTQFPDGTLIWADVQVSSEFQPWGVTFSSHTPNFPRVNPALGGILLAIPGDIGMQFVEPVTSITVAIIGSGLNIGASLEVFDPAGNSLGVIEHQYTGSTGIPSPFTFAAPGGAVIKSASYFGDLNPSAIASIGTLIFTPVPEPTSGVLIGTAFVLLWALRLRGA